MANRKVTKDVSDNVIAGAVLASFPLNKLDRIIEFKGANDVTVKGSNLIPMRIGDRWFLIDTDTDVSTATDMDTGAISNGEDYYVYACDDSGSLVFKISLNSSYPSGFSTATSRKIGGFHTLCVNVGTIGGHDLTDYVANDILPASVWDLKHRPKSEPEGMVYDEGTGIWVDIYLTSGTGASTASVNGGTISDTRDWMDFNDDYAAVKKQMLSDVEFQSIAAGSNEETNINGSADPVTTGGHSDTASRRMISNIGCEDCAGALYQWLSTSSVRADFDIGNDTGDISSGGWYDLAGSKGSFYTYGTDKYMNTQLLAGGAWDAGADCGSRCRATSFYRWHTATDVGGRGRSEPI